MKQIDVDLDVFAAIWSLRIPEERCENDVLKRVLLGSKARPQVDAYTKSASVETDPKPMTANKSKRLGSTELKNELPMGKIRWVDDVVASLKSLGGQAMLHSIYKDVEKRRSEGGRTLPKSTDAVIRRTLEEHSSDSAIFRGNDLFALVGRGEWRLR